MPPTAKRASGAVIVLGCLLLALALVPTASAASPNGDLTPVGCVDLLAVACEGGPTLDDLADALVPSPDGSDLYAVIDGSIRDARLAPGGGLTSGGCWAATPADGCTAQPFIDGTMRNLAISPDGRFAYLATVMHPGSGPAQSLVVFQRDPGSGALSQLQCIGPAPDSACPSATPTHAEGADEVAVSPDGRFVDIAGEQWSRGTYTLDSFARGPDGTLSEVGCLASKPIAGCTTSPALSFTRAIVEAPDRAHVYAAGSSSIVTLARDGAGALHEVGCLSGEANGDPSCQIVPGAATIDTMALSPDGLHAYVLSFDQIWNLHASPDGTLQDAGCGPRGAPIACQPGPFGSTGAIVALDDSALYRSSGGWYPLYLDHDLGPLYGGLSLPSPSAVATTRAGVYFWAGGSLFSFARVAPVTPTCTDTAATVTRPAGTIAFLCTDPRGVPLRFTLDAPPSHGTVPATATGTLGAFQLSYAPAPGSATGDSFTFHVDDGFFAGATQTVTVTIAPAAAAPTTRRAPATTKRLRQIALRLGPATVLRVRKGVTTLTFRCGRVRCRGTIDLLRAGRRVLRARFVASRTGLAHVALHLPRSIRPAGSRRVHLRLRVTAAAAGWRARTLARALTLAATSPPPARV